VGENKRGTPGGKAFGRRPAEADLAEQAGGEAADPKRLVARGYDQIALRYAAWHVAGNPAMRFVRDLDGRLRDGADVLELGCGRGVPVTRELAKRHRVTGVDISAAQIELARHHVPEASFIHADYTDLDIAAGSIDAVVAIFTFTHVPREEHAELLTRIAEWLRDGGYLLATFGTGDDPGSVDPDWLGAPMFFSSFDADTNRGLVRDAGFRVEVEDVIEQDEDEHGRVAFLWVLARKPE
jgi:SAM-dependent methyltransferase